MVMIRLECTWNVLEVFSKSRELLTLSLGTTPDNGLDVEWCQNLPQIPRPAEETLVCISLQKGF